MNTLLYEYLREETYNLWTTYTNRQSIPKEYHLRTFKMLGKQGSHFLNKLVQLQLNTPLFRSVQHVFQLLPSTFHYVQVRQNTLNILYSKDPRQSKGLSQLQAKLQEQYPHWIQNAVQYTPFHHLLELQQKQVLAILGFYIYDPKFQMFRVMVFSLDLCFKYSYKSQLAYYRLPYLRNYEIVNKSSQKHLSEPPVDSEYIRIHETYIKISFDSAKTFVKHIPKKMLEQYAIHKKFLIALDLRIFTDLKSAEIGRTIGYQAANSFQNAFKNHFGMAPGEVQKMLSIL